MIKWKNMQYYTFLSNMFILEFNTWCFMQKAYIYLPYFGFSNLFQTLGPFISNPMVPHLVPKKKTCIHQTFMLLLQTVDKDARKCKNYNKEYIL
jgi:hypothetical protein